MESAREDREERRAQRLRGAQRRQVKDVDFDFDLAALPALAPPQPDAPAPTRRSPRRSLELAPQPSTRPTPTSRAQSQPPVATPQGENIPPIASSTAVVGATSTKQAKHANTSAKRRKLGIDESSTSIRSAVSVVSAPRRDIYALEVGEALELADTTNGSIEQSANIQPTAEDASVIPETAARSPTPLGEVEITESPVHAPGSGQRTRTINQASFQSSRLQDELQLDNPARVEPAGSPTPQRKRKRGTSNDPGTAQSRRTRRAISETSYNANEADEIDELSPEQPKRGRRRRSSIQRESLVSTAHTNSTEEREIAEEIDDAQAATILKQNRRGRISRAPAEASPELDEPSENIPPAKRRRTRVQPTSSPAVQRHPKKANQKSKPSKKVAERQIRSGSPIPITVHRLTMGPVYDEDDSDADILNSEIPYSKRAGVNVVDVLQELSTEIITSALTMLKENLRNTEDPTVKREYRNKLKVVEAFKRELANRLLEHTINLDNTVALEKRLREERKKQAGLRDEIGRIRAEREKVALRMDGVRFTNERESKDANDRDTLNTSIHDIEVAVERGKEKNLYDVTQGPVEKDGIELLLKRIAGEISDKSDSGGILHQIKDFNAFLERAALALEGRKA